MRSPFLLLLSLPLLASASACGGMTTSQPGQAGSSVTGTVADNQGNPAMYMQVMIDGRVETTGADGAFSFTDVPETYDAVLGSGDSAIDFQGLTSRTLVLRQGGFDGQNDLTLAYAIPAPVDATHRLALWATSPDPGVVVGNVWPSGSQLRTSWSGPADARIALHALAYEVDPASGAPMRWTGVATRPAQSFASGDATPWNAQLEPVATSAVPTNVELPAGMALSRLTVAIHLETPDAENALARLESPATSTTILVPRVDGLTFDVMATATSPDGLATAAATNTGPDTPVALKVRPVTRALSPADGASHADLTTVFAAEPSGDVKRVQFLPPQGSASYFSITVVTTASAVTIPDLGALGHALPKSTAYTWSVERFGDATTVDEAAGKDPAEFASKVPWYTESAPRTFTTAP